MRIHMAKWMVAAKKADFDQIAEKFHITPMTARLIRNRDIISEEEIDRFLHGDLQYLHDPLLMKNADKAAGLLINKIHDKKTIRIIGDYDVDGICSTYILLRGMQELGGLADTVIPHRMKDGYGLNDNLIEAAAKEDIDTIVTCDNGIAAASQIKLAKELGMTVVVTDHHEVPFECIENEKKYIVPEAAAVVDPMQPDCPYPFKKICGAVVAYKLVQVMFRLEEQNGNKPRGFATGVLEELLSFAALATVCDVMELQDENRIIVKKGLKLMEHTENPGLKALLTESGLQGKKLSPYHLGFIIGPCLNASGRLDTAARALELFSTDDWKEALTIAADLKSLNDSRKLMTEEGVKLAVKQVEETVLGKDRVLVIYLPDCHESIAGIIAGRIRERFGKPTFVLTRAEDGIKGSGRSIESYSMYEEISACRELFTKYGGHRMAAGVSLAGEEQLKLFRRRLNENCRLTPADFEEVVHIDIPMPLSCASKEFVQEMFLLEPFGVGNPKPLFARAGISLISGRRIGKSGSMGKFKITDENGADYEMVYFGNLEKFNQFLKERFGEENLNNLYTRGTVPGAMPISIAYTPDLNVYAGHESIQIVMQHYC